MADDKIILGLVGEKGSGKGTIADYLKKNHKVVVYRFSKVLNDILDRLYLPKSRENQINLFLTLKEKFGSEVLARVLTNDIKNDKSALIVADGIRRWPELEFLSRLPNFYLIYITADMEKRFERSKLRGEKEGEANMTFQDFKKEEKKPTELEIAAIGKKASFKINNDKTFNELYLQIENIIKKIKTT